LLQNHLGAEQQKTNAVWKNLKTFPSLQLEAPKNPYVIPKHTKDTRGVQSEHNKNKLTKLKETKFNSGRGFQKYSSGGAEGSQYPAGQQSSRLRIF